MHCGLVGEGASAGLDVLDGPIFFTDGGLVELVDAKVASIEIEDTTSCLLIHLVDEARSAARFQAHILALDTCMARSFIGRR